MSAFGIFALVAGFGAAGAAALFFMAPLVAGRLLATALAILEELFRTRVGVGAVVGIACLGVGYLWGDYNGSSRVQDKWNAARIAADARKDQIDTNVADRADKLDKTNVAKENATDRDDQEKIDDFRKNLEGPRCTFDDAALERMLRIGK